MSGIVFQANLHRSRVAQDCLVQDMIGASKQVVALVQEPYKGARGVPLGIPRHLGCHYHAKGGG